MGVELTETLEMNTEFERLSFNENIEIHRNEYSNCEAIFDVFNTTTQETFQVEIRKTQKYEYTMEECEMMAMGIKVRPLVNTKYTSIFTGIKSKNKKYTKPSKYHN